MTHMLNSQKAVSHARILFVILTSVILILTKKISGDAWTRVKRIRICDFRARVLLRRVLLVPYFNLHGLERNYYIQFFMIFK